MISVCLGKIISLYALRSIENISQKVERIQNPSVEIEPSYLRSPRITEIQGLDDFISHTVKKLYDANQTKSHFLMNMSHDLRTPISGISSMSQFIYEKIQDENIKSLQKLVVQSSDQLLEIIDQILGYYQLLHHPKDFSYEKIDIHSLLNDIVLFMSAKSTEKNLLVLLNASPELFFTGDRMILHRMLLNIFSNAIKFTEKGHIKITANPLSYEGKKKIVIKIEDTGIGIDPNHLEMIFEPFYQIESPLTSQYEGIGLGLSHVKAIVEKIGGKINVSSALGVGSIFELILPAE